LMALISQALSTNSEEIKESLAPEWVIFLEPFGLRMRNFSVTPLNLNGISCLCREAQVSTALGGSCRGKK